MVNEEPKVSPNGRYNLSEAAKMLGVGRKTLYRYKETGKLAINYRKCNNLPYIKGSDITKCWQMSY